MKVTSIQFVFDNGATVIFGRGSKEIYNGNQERYSGKPYTYTVIVETKDKKLTTGTFSSPSQDMAKTFLLKALSYDPNE